MKEQTTPAKVEKQANDTRDESHALIPPVDIFDVEGGLAVVVDLPGVGKGDVDIRVEDNVLTIHGKTTYTPHGESLYREFELAPYYRQFQLGELVDREKIRAEMRHGVLTIHLPKVEAAKPKRIKVKVSA